MNKTQSTVRGITVWGEKLRQLRKQRGWTQEEFAHKAGYCDRLIRKAELNGSVSEETLEVLAMTLSDEHCIVTAEELSLSSRITAQKTAQAIISPCDNGLTQLERFSLDAIEVDCLQVHHALPMHGQFVNRSGLHEWYVTLSALLNPEFVSIGNRILLENVVHGFVHASCQLNWPTGQCNSFELDLRFELQDSLIKRICWLSSLEPLVPFAAQWNAQIKIQYQQEIQKRYECKNAQTTA